MLMSVIEKQKSWSGSWLDGGLFELKLDVVGESVNKLSSGVLLELAQVVQAMKAQESKIQGLLITSGKDSFLAGADVGEFGGHFKRSDAELMDWLRSTHVIFNTIEDFKFPSVALLEGFALGGGCELALAAHFRLAAPQTKIGLPETHLGIYPGWGGTIRLSRMAGADTAIEWIASGDPRSAQEALKMGVIDGIVDSQKLRSAGIKLLQSASELKFLQRAAEKRAPLKLNAIESTMVFEGAKSFIQAQTQGHYPAPLAAIQAMQDGAFLERDAAIEHEIAGFAKLTKLPVSFALLSLFQGDQALKKASKARAKGAAPIENAAVLGAGIMGGGIAYQSANSGIPIWMKDIRQEALDLGMKEAGALFAKQVERKKLNLEGYAQNLSRIRPRLDFKELSTNTDLVIEAVVEREDIKKQVLAEVEALLPPTALLASNTSTILISGLAQALKRPELFCGMHFFNPVHKMPLVEVIRGKKTAESTISRVVAYALKLGKTPIVVGDCPGFFVNRVLFPYLLGFSQLLEDGVPIERIDKQMERFGWPMGPAWLMDVIGLDTCQHAFKVMGEGFPDRMKVEPGTVLQGLFEAKRFGQKTQKGFYRYSPNPKGGFKKEIDPDLKAFLPDPSSAKVVSDTQILERLMIPFLLESARCLEDGTLSSPLDGDMGVVYGLGFPPFRGGVFRYADHWGLSALCETAEKWSESHGALYKPSAGLIARASKENFYPR